MHATRRTTRFESANAEVGARCNGYGLAHDTVEKRYCSKFTRFVSLRLWPIDDRSILETNQQARKVILRSFQQSLFFLQASWCSSPVLLLESVD